MSNPHGAGEWKQRHSKILRAADIVVLPDNDEPGRAHADTIIRMSSGIAKRIRVLDLAKHCNTKSQ
jgi:putative DNA primase/helicase